MYKRQVEASELGTWELGIQDNYLEYSPRYLTFLGYSTEEHPNHEELKERIHPDDLKIRAEAFEVAYKTSNLNYTSRLIWRDGSLHWIEVKGKVIFDEAKLPLKIIGTCLLYTSRCV